MHYIQKFFKYVFAYIHLQIYLYIHTDIHVYYFQTRTSYAMEWKRNKKIKQAVNETTICAFPLIVGSKDIDLLV